jgi:hypothetical protein
MNIDHTHDVPCYVTTEVSKVMSEGIARYIAVNALHMNALRSLNIRCLQVTHRAKRHVLC